MKSEVLAHFHLPWLSCLGLLLFLAVFVGALLWVFRAGSKEFYQRLEKLPLNEPGNNHEVLP